MSARSALYMLAICPNGTDADLLAMIVEQPELDAIVAQGHAIRVIAGKGGRYYITAAGRESVRREMAEVAAMARSVRLTNITSRDIEIDDGAGGRLRIPAGATVGYPGEIAGPDLRSLLAEGDLIIADDPPGMNNHRPG